ncbi:hypothetical protein ACLOJK_016947 [Asimina triloba]
MGKRIQNPKRSNQFQAVREGKISVLFGLKILEIPVLTSLQFIEVPTRMERTKDEHSLLMALIDVEIIAAFLCNESGGPIFAYALPLKIADPFDFGGGIVNPNKAANPGLIYDMGMEDYVHYLCSRGYHDSDISRVTAKPTVCPSKRPSTLDMNLPSIAIPSLESSVTISRTLTNVGPVKSVYKASIQLPPGINAAVSPSVLEFNSKAKKLSFTVTFSSAQKVQGGYYFGSLTWSDGVHNVRSPIAVRPEIIPFYTDNA